MHPLFQIALGLLGATLSGLLVYHLGLSSCVAPRQQPFLPCWEPAVAGTLAAALGWAATSIWIRLGHRSSGA